MEKKKPGTIAGIFSSHPMTGSRIQAAQKEIQQDLKPQPQYVVDTSEFEKIKARLEAIEGRRKIDNKDMNRPTLRHSTQSGSDDTKDDGRPTLKRRN
jgi:predicted Zn-dependent protease